MKCTDCGAGTEIIDTQKYDTFVWRRRRCPKCNHRMNTHETVVESKQNSRVLRSPKAEQPAPKRKAERKLKLVATPPPKPQPAAVIKSTRQLLEEIRDLQTFRDDDWPD